MGSTGSHYSPTVQPYDFCAGPLHQAFWKRVLAGEPPAQALHHAKFQDYLTGIPHRNTPVMGAYERKTLWEFTCLGLGW